VQPVGKISDLSNSVATVPVRLGDFTAIMKAVPLDIFRTLLAMTPCFSKEALQHLDLVFGLVNKDQA
jgi:hypothetical protein